MASPPNVSIVAIEAVLTASETWGAEEQVHHFRCTLADFERLQLEDLLVLRYENRGIYELSLNPHKETLSFLTSPTRMCSAPRMWLMHWGFDLKRYPELRGIVRVSGGGWLRSRYFGGQYMDSGIDLSTAIYSENSEPLPSIVLDTGYTKPYTDLVDDATLLLEGFQGRVGMVIIVKMQPLKEGETSLQYGFVEVWRIDREDMKARIYGQRQQLYPVPRHHSCQQVPISWQDILMLGDQSPGVVLKEDPPPLKLDDLRRELDIDVERHIMFG